MKKIIYISVLFFAALTASAQQDAMFTHYMFNTLGVNPGYAGSRDAVTVTGIHRSQWLDFPGAPVTQTLTLHSPIKGEKIGLGLSVINDKIGPTNVTAIYGDFAYRIPVTEKGKLALGIKGGINLRSNKLTDLTVLDQGDKNFGANVQGDILPNFGFGAYYYAPRFYVGASAPKLLSNQLDPTVSGNTVEERHYFLIAGSVFDLSPSIKFKPTGFLKVTESAPIEGDITGTFIFNDKLSAGVMFRSNDAFGALLGFNITEQLRIGYSFDYSYTNTTFTYNTGSHEIMLRYDWIFKNEGRILSPRYF